MLHHCDPDWRYAVAAVDGTLSCVITACKAINGKLTGNSNGFVCI